MVQVKDKISGLKSTIYSKSGRLGEKQSGDPGVDVSGEVIYEATEVVEDPATETSEEKDFEVTDEPEGKNGKARKSLSLKKLFSSKSSFAVSRKKEIKEEVLSDPEEIPFFPPEPDFLIEQGFTEIERHWLKAPHSYVCIYEDTNKNSFYKVFEPEITMKERIILEETDSHLKSVIIYDNPAEKRPKAIESGTISAIARNFDSSITKERIGVIEYYLRRNFEGYGKLDPLMRDENIEDITCNGSRLPVYIYHRKYANLPTNIIFEPVEINRFVLKLAQKADKQLSLTTPLVDAALPEGARAQITYTDVVSSKGSSFTIRKFRSEPMTPIDLIYY